MEAVTWFIGCRGRYEMIYADTASGSESVGGSVSQCPQLPPVEYAPGREAEEVLSGILKIAQRGIVKGRRSYGAI